MEEGWWIPLGYGVMSFGQHLIIANKSSWLKKIIWVLGGWLAIWCINVFRISFLMISTDKHWDMPLGLKHHT